jgi:uncharacterized membrane protein
MKSTQYRNLLLHSVLIFVLSFILNTIIHEGAHAIMAKVCGLNPVLHHNYVSTPEREDATQLVKILIPAAGPLMSLLQGIIFLFLLRNRNQKSLNTLFFLWMSVMGFINFGGYLMLTPLVPYGDTGKVFTLLNSPQWLKWVVCLLGLAGLMKLILSLAPDFEAHVPANERDQRYVPGKLANLLIAFPVLAGCVVTSLLSLPVPTFISIVYPATSPFITFMIYGELRRKKDQLLGKAVYPDTISIPLAAFTVLAIVISRLLVSGVSL